MFYMETIFIIRTHEDYLLLITSQFILSCEIQLFRLCFNFVRSSASQDSHTVI
jgi:hypothetical protein